MTSHAMSVSDIQRSWPPLTIDTGSTPHTLPALDYKLAVIQVLAWLSNDVLDGLGLGREMREEACRLQVRQVILGRRPYLEHQDAQRRVRYRQSPKDYPGSGTTYMPA